MENSFHHPYDELPVVPSTIISRAGWLEFRKETCPWEVVSPSGPWVYCLSFPLMYLNNKYPAERLPNNSNAINPTLLVSTPMSFNL
jgi:hypothetical protein